MKIAVLYTYVSRGPLSDDYAARFVATWEKFPPDYDCDLIVCCNGGPPTIEGSIILNGRDAQFFVTNNEGYDIGAYTKAAHGPANGYDAVFCCGESIYFWRRGWLNRLVDAWLDYGEGMYGVISSYLVRPHLGTSAFMTSPGLLHRYPFKVHDRKTRYEYEHGKQSFWLHVNEKWHLPVRLVTWDGSYSWRDWRKPANIMWRGDQSNCLVRCIHLDRYDKVLPATKRAWERGADGFGASRMVFNPPELSPA